ncbi:MAG: PAS domain-containing protein, partial [Actinomycetes bacterium]
IEMRLRSADGAYRWMSIHAKPTIAADGSLSGRVVGLRDVQREVLGRQELAVQQERLKLVLAGTRLGLWDWNMVTDELVVDEQWAQVLGYRLEELSPVTDRVWQNLCHPQDLARSDETVDRVAKGVVSHYDLEVRMRHRDGHWVWVRDRGTIVGWTEDGRPARMTGTHEDITELVHSRELAQAERTRLRATMDSLMDPHVLMEAVRDATGEIVDFVYTDANPAACADTGLAYVELVGSRLTDVVPEHARSELVQTYRQVVETGEPLALDDFAYVVDPDSKNVRYHDRRAVRIGDGISYTWRDITDRHTAVADLAASERQYRLLAENASDIVFRGDNDGVLSWLSPSVTDLLGWLPEEMVGHPFVDFVHPLDRPAIKPIQQQLMQARESKFAVRLRKASGDYLWVSALVRPVLDSDGNVVSRCGGWHNIDDEVAAREQLASSEHKFRLAMEGAPQGMAIADLDEKLIEVNAALCEMVGRDPNWMTEHRETDFIHPEALATYWAAREQLLIGDRDYNTHESRLVTATDSVVWVEHSLALIRDEQRTPLFYVSQFKDITELRAARIELLHQAGHDQLTGLINRGQLQERINTVLLHGQEPDGPPALLFCDLDFFKNVNDTYGHGGGDEALRIIAERMSSLLRKGDEVARLGGDEFVILLGEVQDLTAAKAVAEKIRKAVAKPMALDGKKVRITLSIGVALATPGLEADQLLRNADTALYEAKNSGRDRIATFATP